MLNFRKLRQDFSAGILKEGKELFDKGCVELAKILHLDGDTVRLSSRVKGVHNNMYECEIEIDRSESIAIDSNCDCTYTYDCQHISALLFHLEQHLNAIVVAYSKETDLEACEKIDDAVKKELRETFEKAATKEVKRRDLALEKEVLSEYISSAKVLSSSPFFLRKELLEEDKAELGLVFALPPTESIDARTLIDVQIALRLSFRSKPFIVPNVKAFLEALRYKEPCVFSGRKFFFTPNSFDTEGRQILEKIMQHAKFYGAAEEKQLRLMQLDVEAFGALLAHVYDLGLAKGSHFGEKEIPFPCLFNGNLEEPLCFSIYPSSLQFTIEYIEAPAPMLLLKPQLVVEDDTVPLKEALLFESAKPGLIHKNTYYRFQREIKRVHLKNLNTIECMTIPEPLFGTFIENALPVLKSYAEVTNPNSIKRFVTLPFTGEVKGRCEISYLNGELEAKFFFLYDTIEIPASFSVLDYAEVTSFVTKEGILARNLVEERQMLEDVFTDFLFSEKEGLYKIKSEKKIVEFMTEVIPRNQHRIDFKCPENLSDQFIYDETTFELSFNESERVDAFAVELKVNGGLRGASLDLLWECLASKKRFVELSAPKVPDKKIKNRIPRILVLDLEKLTPLVQLFDEIGIKKLENHVDFRPLWSLTTIHPDQFKNIPVKFSMSDKLKEIQKQIIGETLIPTQKIPQQIQADLRKYQIEGVKWLERLRHMHLNGILADDMGLGKTLQAIIAITQSKLKKPQSQSLIIAPTSLVYNWKEEFSKFNPNLKVLVVDNIPSQRKKMLKDVASYDILVTSYNLLQKDVEIYKGFTFDYVILDEAQHIKNRSTRNAKSVKQIQAAHRLILTGTPIENSLEELWSLFDFLMPGLLSTYDRFVEKYIRVAPPSPAPLVTSSVAVAAGSSNLDNLRKKLSPFILRRMKEEVLDDLPPVSEIYYHCHLTDTQKELYQSYAASAKEELSKLVKKEGFEKIQIHVLATLTRLKQICCHPAIFAKDKREVGDSAKYDMLMELLPSLMEGKHKTVIFSQYTKMLSILREDLEQKGYKFSYLDGSSKNRLELVKQFNEDPTIPIFLVSLKAGGSGLNLVGADTVIHYDMWWNPAVENQATDRVHRIGQKKSVSSYKLITLNTIEEKIRELHRRKQGLVKKVISSDDEALAKLTWEEVLELLQT